MILETLLEVVIRWNVRTDLNVPLKWRIPIFLSEEGFDPFWIRHEDLHGLVFKGRWGSRPGLVSLLWVLVTTELGMEDGFGLGMKEGFELGTEGFASLHTELLLPTSHFRRRVLVSDDVRSDGNQAPCMKHDGIQRQHRHFWQKPAPSATAPRHGGVLRVCVCAV